MRKIIQYMMMALIAVVLASCANDISEESTPTVKSNIRFVVDDFPMFEKPSTRTIGEEDKGKSKMLIFWKRRLNSTKMILRLQRRSMTSRLHIVQNWKKNLQGSMN